MHFQHVFLEILALGTQPPCYKEALGLWRDPHGEKPQSLMHSSSQTPGTNLLAISHASCK